MLVLPDVKLVSVFEQVEQLAAVDLVEIDAHLQVRELVLKL